MSETNFFPKCNCAICGEHIEFPSELAGTEIDCPHCGQKTKLSVAQNFIQPKKFVPWVMVFGAVIFLALNGAVIFHFFGRKKIPAAPIKTPVVLTPSTNPANGKAIVTNEFEVRPAEIQRAGPRLIYAFGMLQNLSSRQRFGVRVELDLFDASGEKLGVATDYIPVVEAKQQRSYRALVTEVKTISAKLSSIKEDQ